MRIPNKTIITVNKLNDQKEISLTVEEITKNKD